MKIESRAFKDTVRCLLIVLSPLSLIPLPAQDQPISREKRFVAYTASGRAVDVWLQSHVDFDLVSTATTVLDHAEAPLLPIARNLLNAVFLSAQAVQLLDKGDRSEVKTLMEQGVPIICECGEYVLSRVLGFTPLEQDSTDPFEFFVYRQTSAGVLRTSVLFSGLTDRSNWDLPRLLATESAETLPLLDTTDPRVRDELRAFLLREALRQSLEDGPPAGGKPERVALASPAPAAGEGSWSNLADVRKVWSWTTPEVACATSPPCWDWNKQANAFTVTADFFKIPDGKVATDYYLVRVTSHHDANYKVAYLNTAGWCSDGWLGWYVPGRALKIERTDGTSALYEYGPTGTLKQQTISYTLGASLDTQGIGVNGSFSVSYTNSDATVNDRSSLKDNYADWAETFIVPFWGYNVDTPSPVARESFSSQRAAIYSTLNPAGGINLKISPYAMFEKTRFDYGTLCSGPNHIRHRYEVYEPRTVNIRWNYPPNTPLKPSLTIPPGSTALWTNTPLIVNVPATTDRDGDTITYSVYFGDGTTGPSAAATQTHSWTRPEPIQLKAMARDMHGASSEWSEVAKVTIKGLDRIQIEGGLPEIPEMASMNFQCRAMLSDGTTQLVTSDYPSGWEGGVIRWSVASPYATISGTGLLTALGVKGADRVITVNAAYTLKGIEKTASQTVIIKHVGAEQLVPAITSVVNGASFLPGISGSAWATIKGTNLAGTARSWRSDEIIGGKLSTVLDEVSVTMNGKPAAICYVHPTQLNVQIPSGIAAGPVTVRVTTAYGSATTTAQMDEFSPGFFTFGVKYVAAQHADYSYLAPYGFFTGLITFPARPGEVVILYGTGFGPTVPELPSGEVITTVAPLANPVTVWIGNRVADVQWKGVSGAGLWQLNVVIPDGLPAGDNALVAEVGGVRTQPGVFISIAGGVL